MKLKNLGVWAATDGLSAAATAAFARRLEAWGYGPLWISEAVGREVFSASAWLLANTSTLIIASGIAISSIDDLAHGSTVATNAVLERKGFPTAFVTTQGFRDILALQRHGRSRMTPAARWLRSARSFNCPECSRCSRRAWCGLA